MLPALLFQMTRAQCRLTLITPPSPLYVFSQNLSAPLNLLAGRLSAQARSGKAFCALPLVCFVHSPLRLSSKENVSWFPIFRKMQPLFSAVYSFSSLHIAPRQGSNDSSFQPF